jgi:hydroxymethylpyrimidine/phosphomethylpyrimidine kinase
MKTMPGKPCVLVFSGLDPSGGAGIQADIDAIGALGAHALPVITVLTVQDNDRVRAIYPVDAAVIEQQVRTLMAKMHIAAVKIGALGNYANAEMIVALVAELRLAQPDLPVVLDPVLASGHGDALAAGDARAAVNAWRGVASVITPNLPEAAALELIALEGPGQGQALLRFAPHVLLKGGHAHGDTVDNHWLHAAGRRSWRWPRLAGAFHGSGCTLAAAIAALLAQGKSMEQALETAQAFSHAALSAAYRIADGQLIPQRTHLWNKEHA